MKSKTAAALLIAFSSCTPMPAAAAETWLTATTLSHHHDRSKRHEEQNWGLGIEHHLTRDWSLNAGGYRNSFSEPSYYVGGAWMPLHAGHFHLGVAIGEVTGYRQKFSGYIIPTLTIQGKTVGVNIGVVPSSKESYTVIGVQVKVKL